MKLALLQILLLTCIININCQNTSVSKADALSKKINRLLELKYSSTNLPESCYQFDVNLADSILIFRSPNTLHDEDKPSSISINIMPIKNLHSKSSLAFNYEYEEGCIFRIVPRQYKEGIFSYLVSIEDFLLYGDAAPNKFAISPINFFGIIYKDCVLLREISTLFEQFIQEMNPNIPKDEEPPNPKQTRLTEKSLRNVAGNLVSNLEKNNPNKLVLPTYNVDLDNQPLFGTNETLENSIISFESKIINLAKENNIKTLKDISGDLVIDEEGNIVEVLMVYANTPELGIEIAPNEKIRKYILNTEKWIPAKQRGKQVAVKVRFYISKGKINRF